ncbi:MAG: L,D-transpeptidase [Deltaproteobacteria bacterium]|nr:L,D-transpeptidase [Deltaproteobacteria bacterium]
MKPAWAGLLAGACLLGCAKREPTPSAAPPAGPRYYLVGENAIQTRDGRKLLPGFGVVVVDQHVFGGERLGRTSLGREVAMKDLRPAKPSRFAGVHLQDAKLDFGWVARDRAPVYAEPDTNGKPVARRPRYARLGLASRDGPRGFFRVAEGWMSDADLRVPHRSPRPAEVGDGEPWLDVELATQTLVAYVGDKPVFATLVATGVGAEGTVFATPRGIHRVRAKLLGATMDNLEHTDVVPYYYEEVPFTQYIGRVALHGVFWHDQFGAPRSHGCINLSLADAEWLFGFTEPPLRNGETEAAATDKKPGTVVRVR